MLRELRSHDSCFKNPENLRWNPVSKRFAGAGVKAEEEEDQDVVADNTGTVDGGGGGKDVGETAGKQNQPRLLTKENPIGVGIYGQICLAAKSYQSALCEWLAA